MPTFDESKHPRGGDPRNLGRFSVVELDVVSLDTLNSMSDPLVEDLKASLDTAIDAFDDLPGYSSTDDDGVYFTDSLDDVYRLDYNGSELVVYPEEDGPFSAQFFTARDRSKLPELAARALKDVRLTRNSEASWNESIDSLRTNNSRISTNGDGAYIVHFGDRAQMSSFTPGDGELGVGPSALVQLDGTAYIFSSTPSGLSAVKANDFDAEPGVERDVLAEFQDASGMPSEAVADLLDRTDFSVTQRLSAP